MKMTDALKAEVRKKTGSKDAVKVRKNGRIPAILYGHKEENVAVLLDEHNLSETIQHGQRLLDIQIGRKTQKAIIKELQYDYLGKKIIHVDLMRVDVKETIRVPVPIEIKGKAIGTHEGGIIEEHADHLEVECKATEIPESIVVSVKDLDVGDALHARDIELPVGVKLVSDMETLLVTCSLVAAAKSTEELEEEIPVAPEVIGEEKEEKEESAEQEDEKKQKK